MPTISTTIIKAAQKRPGFALNGGHWPQPIRITYSYMPDGTNIGGASSNLFASLGATFTLSTWQQIFKNAFAMWATVSPLNFTPVADDGSTWGLAGDQQGASNIGDIRIGGFTTALDGGLAETLGPPPATIGVTAGDILLGTQNNWSSTGLDLQTVVSHEIGHALGLAHDTVDTTAIMYPDYNGVKHAPTADDTSGLQAIYGPILTDPYNTVSTRAIDLTQWLNGSQIALSNLYMTGSGKQNWFRVVVPTNGTMVVKMQSTGLSLLSPHLTLFNSALSGLTSASANGAFGASIILTWSAITGQIYYIRATSDVTGLGSTGAYALLLAFNAGTPTDVAPPSTATP